MGTGQTTSECAGGCTAGTYCGTGVSPKDCGSVDKYCPAGVAAPKSVRAFYYTVLGIATQRQGEKACEPGFVCEGGIRTACPKGYWCKDGATNPCTTPAFFCTEGSSAPERVTVGYYSVQSALVTSGSAVGRTLRIAEKKCEAGRFCASTTVDDGKGGLKDVGAGKWRFCGVANLYSTTGAVACIPVTQGAGTAHYSIPVGAPVDKTLQRKQRTGQSLCPRGHYCVDGIKNECPPGKFGSTAGLDSAACSGPCTGGGGCSAGSVSATGKPCKAGYYCEPGSTCEAPIPCGGIAYFCEVMSSKPTLAVPGIFTTPVDGSAANRTGFAKCVAGFFCVGGQQQECGAANLYSSAGASKCTLVKDKYYSTGSVSSRTRSGQSICPQGHYCLNGNKSPCPSGKYGRTATMTSDCEGPCKGGYFGDAAGQDAPECAGQCTQGYYCPPGSTSAQQKPCGGEGVYCPVGVDSPVRVDDGWYSTPVAVDVNLRPSTSKCEPGYWCKAGKRHECGSAQVSPGRFYCSESELSAPIDMKQGYYGEGKSIMTLTAKFPCTAGYYCVDGEKKECGNPGVYCPEGAGQVALVNTGWYGTGGSTSSTNSMQVRLMSGELTQI